MLKLINKVDKYRTDIFKIGFLGRTVDFICIRALCQSHLCHESTSDFCESSTVPLILLYRHKDDVRLTEQHDDVIDIKIHEAEGRQ